MKGTSHPSFSRLPGTSDPFWTWAEPKGREPFLMLFIFRAIRNAHDSGKDARYGKEASGMKYLEIDVSDVLELAHGLAKNLSHDKAVTMMRRTFWEAGNRVPTILRDIVPEDYEVTKGWVSKHVGTPHMGGSLGEVSVVVPLKGARGSIGGTFPASGGYHRQTHGTQVHMKDGTVRNRKAYWRDARVQATILKGQKSELPATMDHQGGNPPFMAGGVGFTRTTKKRLPIAHVVGLGLPQMPLNQSEKKARKEIEEYTMKRLIHNFEFLLSR